MQVIQVCLAFGSPYHHSALQTLLACLQALAVQNDAIPSSLADIRQDSCLQLWPPVALEGGGAEAGEEEKVRQVPGSGYYRGLLQSGAAARDPVSHRE